MTPPEHTQLDDLRDAVEDLQRERVESRDHRTRVQTLLTLAGAAAIAVVLGAVTVRDTVLRVSGGDLDTATGARSLLGPAP